MVVSWKVKLSNDKFHEGNTEDGSWKNLPETIKNYKCSARIVNMSIGNENGGGTIDQNADGYFLGNKVIAIMPSNVNINLVGIGYWKKHDNMVRIKWYDSTTMSLCFTEARGKNECSEPYFVENL